MRVARRVHTCQQSLRGLAPLIGCRRRHQQREQVRLTELAVFIVGIRHRRNFRCNAEMHTLGLEHRRIPRGPCHQFRMDRARLAQITLHDAQRVESRRHAFLEPRCKTYHRGQQSVERFPHTQRAFTTADQHHVQHAHIRQRHHLHRHARHQVTMLGARVRARKSHAGQRHRNGGVRITALFTGEELDVAEVRRELAEVRQACKCEALGSASQIRHARHDMAIECEFGTLWLDAVVMSDDV